MPASNLAVVFQPGLIRGPDNLDPISGVVPGAIPIPNAASVPNSGEASEASSAFSPPVFPQMSRSSSNPANQLPEPASSASSTTGNQNNVLELQRRQDEIKINQEVLEFLINHQDHFVALPEPQSSSSTEASPVSPQSATGAPAWSQQTPVKQPAASRGRAPQQLLQTQTTLADVQQQQRHDYPLSPPQAPFASMRLASGSRQSSPTRAAAASDAPTIAGRSQSVQHEKVQLAPISTARAPVGPATATFPVKEYPLHAQQPPATEQTSARSASKDKDRDKDSRQPRKLKKGRTPNTSGTGTPISPPPGSTAFWDPGQPQYQLQPGTGQSFSAGSSPVRYTGPSSGRVSHVESSMPSPVQSAIATSHDDEDVPLSATTVRGGSISPGGGVKRSRTLPPGGSPRGASPRSVCVFLSTSAIVQRL